MATVPEDLKISCLISYIQEELSMLYRSILFRGLINANSFKNNAHAYAFDARALKGSQYYLLLLTSLHV